MRKICFVYEKLVILQCYMYAFYKIVGDLNNGKRLMCREKKWSNVRVWAMNIPPENTTKIDDCFAMSDLLLGAYPPPPLQISCQTAYFQIFIR
jgi:hypothetical protein